MEYFSMKNFLLGCLSGLILIVGMKTYEAKKYKEGMIKKGYVCIFDRTAHNYYSCGIAGEELEQ